MREILGKAKTVRELLKGSKYGIDYYQREYNWQEKQIRELIDDLTTKFLEDYEPDHDRQKVAEYSRYFLGSIIVSRRDGGAQIVDGQQRLTSLTLLLIYLRNAQKGEAANVNVDELIFSEKYGNKSFNIHVDERLQAMEALYDGLPFDTTGRSESVVNLVGRYTDIGGAFPDEARGDALPFFIDWLMENVNLVEITAYSDDDAYTIFETMNDRGLSLSPTEMLKGYLLANTAAPKRIAANDLWRVRIRELNEEGKEVEADCLKTWLRSQFANRIRERRRGAKPEEFDRIGTEFHRWVRDSSRAIGLQSSEDFNRFIQRDFDFYSRQYLRVARASRTLVAGMETIYYNAQLGFSLQNLLLLAPLQPGDDQLLADAKMRLAAKYVDILLSWRIWNFRSIAYSTMQYAMFLIMRDIRGLGTKELGEHLHASLKNEHETFTSSNALRFRVHQQNRYAVHRVLARITDYLEVQSSEPSRYQELVAEGPNRFEVEHIWADHPERHEAEFSHPADFSEFRNRIGGLLLVPKKFNASYGDLPYDKKVPHYISQNMLARSLHQQCYTHNPGFVQFLGRSGLSFRPHDEYLKADIEERSALYRQLAERIWNPDDLLIDGINGV